MSDINNSTNQFENFKKEALESNADIYSNTNIKNKSNLQDIETRNFIIEKIKDETSRLYLPLFNNEIAELRKNIKDVDEKGYMTQKHAGWLSIIIATIFTIIITIAGFAFRNLIIDAQQNENKILKESFNDKIEIINNNFNERMNDMKDFINITNQPNNSQPASQTLPH